MCDKFHQSEQKATKETKNFEAAVCGSPVKILVIPDKFKGTLTASAAANAIARGWRKARPRDSVELLPMSDGGDGFGEVMSTVLKAKIRRVKTVDAAHRVRVANWWWESKTKTAIIESASVIGLAKLPFRKFHPFELDTFGLGKVIQAAAQAGARRCIIGIGGSATNDGGFGLARAVGWKFLDGDGHSIERWTELRRLARVVRPKRQRWFKELIVAVDVQNPLLGVRGATRIYGPQKGLRSSEFAEAERNLRRLACVLSRSNRLKPELQACPGAGAAGGLGFGLMTFLGAKLEPGFELFARNAELDRRFRDADLVITGEGRIDESTFMGKGTGEVARWCNKWNVPSILLAGDVFGLVPAHLAPPKTHSLTELTSAEAAKTNADLWLERLAERVARAWKEAKA